MLLYLRRVNLIIGISNELSRTRRPLIPFRKSLSVESFPAIQITQMSTLYDANGFHFSVNILLTSQLIVPGTHTRRVRARVSFFSRKVRVA